MRTLHWLPLFALAAACGPREPGPHESERGQVIYWRVIDVKQELANCSDNTDFTEKVPPPPKFEPNTFLIYKLATDGKKAVSQDCETTLASSCIDSKTGIVFDVSGHDLVFDPLSRLIDIAGSACDLEADDKWTLTDKGEQLTMVVETVFRLVGDATTCADIENQQKTSSPNGKGFEGCTISLRITTDYDH